MEKVKVTKEQAEAIEEIKDVDYAINIHSFKKRPDNPLASLETSELARALFVGYEVEPEFKVGDWVINHNGTIGKITNINEFGEFEGFWENAEMLCEKDNFVRHATPSEIAEEKERRWWKKHGRDVWELRKGDVLYDSIEEEALVFEKYDQDLDDEVAHFTNGLWEPMRNVKRRLRVVSFAEQRLDREVGK